MSSTAARPDAFQEARRHSLIDFLERELGVKGRRSGKHMRYSACPACGPSEDLASTRLSATDTGFRCFACDAKGDIVDAASKLWACSPLEAARRILSQPIDHPLPVFDRQQIKQEASLARQQTLSLMQELLPKLWSAIQPYQDDPACLHYLSVERGLPISLVKEAQQRRMLGFLPADPRLAKEVLLTQVGEDLLRRAGLWKPDSRIPGVTYRPIVFFLPGYCAAEFRVLGVPKKDAVKSIRYGITDKPWFWRGTFPKSALIVEGFIDMLSAVALGYRGHIIGLPGCNVWNPQWFPQIAKRWPIDMFHVCLDNDADDPKNPGQKWAGKICEALSEAKLAHDLRVPSKGDINDILLRKAARKAA